jgi:hypothetical protein
MMASVKNRTIARVSRLNKNPRRKKARASTKRRRPMTALQRKYFGPRRSRVTRVKRNPPKRRRKMTALQRKYFGKRRRIVRVRRNPASPRVGGSLCLIRARKCAGGHLYYDGAGHFCTTRAEGRPYTEGQVKGVMQGLAPNLPTQIDVLEVVPA